MPTKTWYRWPSWPVMKCHHCLRSHSQQTITRTSKPTIHICWSVEIVRHSIFLSVNCMVGTTPCPCRPVLSVRKKLTPSILFIAGRSDISGCSKLNKYYIATCVDLLRTERHTTSHWCIYNTTTELFSWEHVPQHSAAACCSFLLHAIKEKNTHRMHHPALETIQLSRHIYIQWITYHYPCTQLYIQNKHADCGSARYLSHVTSRDAFFLACAQLHQLRNTSLCMF